MSIANRINEIRTHLTNDWNSVEALTGTATVDKNIENIASVLDNLYEELPKVTGTGTSLSLSTRAGKMKLSLKGNTSQTGTPTPDNPIPVNVVSGDNEVVVTGKNFYNNENTTATANATIVKSATGFTFTRTASGSNDIFVATCELNLEANTTYSMYAKNNDFSAQFYFYSDTLYGTALTRTLISNTSPNTAYKFTTDGTGHVLIGFYAIGQSQGTIKTYDNIVIYKGDYTLTQLQEYEPYQSTSYPINLPIENIYEGSQDFSGEWTNASYWQTDSSTFNNCVVKKNNGSWNGLYKTFSIKSGETYTYSIYAKADENRTAGLYLDNSVTPRSVDINLTTEWTRYSVTFTATSSTNNLRPRLENQTSSTTNFTYIACPQLEKGSKANSYTPYGTTPITPNSISTYKDEFFKAITGDSIYDSLDSATKETLEYGEWYLEEKIGKYTFTGNESWNLASSGTNTNLYWAQLTYISADVLSNYFTRNDNLYNEDVEGMRGVENNDRMWFRINKTTASDKDAFKTWLSTHNTIVYYILETPTYTKIEGTLKDELEAVWRAYSYKGQTNINQVNNDLPFNLDVTALGE